MPLARVIFVGEFEFEAPFVFGIHRYHHVAGDDERCLNPAGTAAAADGFRRLIQTVVSR